MAHDENFSSVNNMASPYVQDSGVMTINLQLFET